MDLLQQLNEPQQQAVQSIKGPVMVIAGAGSGKTRALTYRIAYMLQQGIDAFSILALTFTNKAAREMKERVIQLVGDQEGRNVWMGTFHAIFARILRVEGHHLGYPSNFTIYDTDDTKQLMRNILKELNLDPKVYKPSFVLHRISNAKSNLFSAQDYLDNPDIRIADQQAGKPLIGEIFKAYSSRLKRANAMDFDDLLFNTNVLLRDFPEVLYKYQHRFKYILVDEYQDTNHAQYLIIKRIAALNENICVVGDDAQSIYAFRGANIQNILNFKSDYPDHQLVRLEQNYRSTKTIVAAANKVIENNKDQIKKLVWTDKENGELISLLRATSDNEEGVLVANAIFGHKMAEQLNNKDFVILYRTNAQSRSIEEALRKHGIAYRIYGGLSFYARKEVKDLLSYFRLVINPQDEEALLRVINYPARGIGKTTIERLLVAANVHQISIWDLINEQSLLPHDINRGALSKINDFVAMIKSFQALHETKSAFELAKHINSSVGLVAALKEDDSPEGISRIENIEELLNAIMEFSDKQVDEATGEQVGIKLADFMQDIALLTDADKKDPDDDDYVSMMTIHAAKGLEFPYVFVVGIEENLFPSVQSLGTRAELEEERRLFYVAITRAEKKLTLSYAESRYRWGNLSLCEPSRFLEEIDESLIDRPRKTGMRKKTSLDTMAGFSKMQPEATQRADHSPNKSHANDDFEASDPDDLQNGMQVIHQKFGKGKIVNLEGNGPNKKATVQFAAYGQKQLLLKFARLKIV
ncbi:MAG: UvrD-helicase domain-containing protein [Bacteroidetes bacterium]|nr:UvrD-helicase domain-containing protein [Bacteroidota bacterium]MBU1579879.1 UvrD-helicase domain-containing protein [Bacteroidota bacterium]MBU2556193.1 UvrD-helicase domain-containing protein [Bacteroidota bacterium]